MSRHSPHVHSCGTATSVVALQMEQCYATRIESRTDPDQELLRLLAGQMNFINSLYHPKARHTFAIRYYSAPVPERVASGKIEIVLFAKVESTSRTAAKSEASALCDELMLLLAGHTPQYKWRVVSEKEEFKRLWEPFPLAEAHVLEIRHREEKVYLESPQSRPSLGRGRKAEESAIKAGDGIYFVHQFLPRASTLEHLLCMFQQHDVPAVLQIVLKPTRLTPQEKGALEAELVKCEKSLKRSSSEYAPVKELRADALRRGLQEQIQRLEDAPFEMCVSLSSPARIPWGLAEAAGIEITRPVWTRLDDKRAPQNTELQGGGYDIIPPRSAQETTQARRNLADLDTGPWSPGFAPKGLERLRSLVDAGEAATAFRFPVATSFHLPGVPVQLARCRPLPSEQAALAGKPEEALLIGTNQDLGREQPVYLSGADRSQHTYVVGQTGVGKTTLLKAMILADIQAGNGLAVIDPHGDLFQEILEQIPPHRLKDVVILDPTDMDHPVGINLLECQNEEERYFVVREMVGIMHRLIQDQYGPAAIEWTGPFFYRHMQMNLLLAMSDPSDPGTLLEFYEIFQSEAYWKRWLPLRIKDAQLETWVTQTLSKMDYTVRSSDRITLGEYISSKFEDFVFDPKLRLLFGQKHSTIQIRNIMDEGKILLVNLAKGPLTEANSRFLGMILLAKIQTAAMSRYKLPKAQRRPFYLYVDEFQSLATENFTLLLSESRKFGLGLVLANQFMSQIKDPNIMQGISGNVGTTISFRVGMEDSKLLEPRFQPYFDHQDLTNMPNWTACVRTTVAGQTTAPFTLLPLCPAIVSDPQAAKLAREHSRQTHGREREDVEREIREGLLPNKRRYPAYNLELMYLNDILAGKV